LFAGGKPGETEVMGKTGAGKRAWNAGRRRDGKAVEGEGKEEMSGGFTYLKGGKLTVGGGGVKTEEGGGGFLLGKAKRFQGVFFG